jgi:hypothetical protein
LKSPLTPARASRQGFCDARAGFINDFVFPSRIHSGKPMSTRQNARLVDEWVTAIGLRREQNGTHSMRRTEPATSGSKIDIPPPAKSILVS